MWLGTFGAIIIKLHLSQKQLYFSWLNRQWVAGAGCNKNRDGKGFLIRRHSFFSPMLLSFLWLIHFSAEIHTRRTVGRRQEVGWQKILSFRRSIAFQIAQSSNSTRDWMGSHSLYDRIVADRGAGERGRGRGKGCGYIFRLFHRRLIRLRGKISIRRALWIYTYTCTYVCCVRMCVCV